MNSESALSTCNETLAQITNNNKKLCVCVFVVEEGSGIWSHLKLHMSSRLGWPKWYHVSKKKGGEGGCADGSVGKVFVA